MAYSFNGSSDYFTSALSGSSTPATIAAIYLTNNTTAGSFQAVTWRAAGNSAKQALSRTGNLPRALSVVAAGTAGASTSTATITASAYYHVAGTFSGAASRKVFVDGAAQTENTANRAVPAIDTVLLGVGTDNAGTGALAEYHAGNLAEVGIWSAVLTDAEIASLAKGFSPRRVRPQNLIYYAPLRRQTINWKAGALTVGGGAPAVQVHPRVYA